MGRGYRVPTNIELVEEADLVVLARVVDGDVLAASERDPREPRVVFQPVETLKGGPTPAALEAYGYLGSRGVVFEPQATPLDEPHPSTLWGACIRQA